MLVGLRLEDMVQTCVRLHKKVTSAVRSESLRGETVQLLCQGAWLS